MINERDIAERFTGIWKQNFPFLSPNFIKVVNESGIKKINTESILMNSNVRHDLVSELAFNLAEMIFMKETSIIEFFHSEQSVSQLVKKTAENIWKQKAFSSIDLKLNGEEAKETEKICRNILQFLEHESSNRLVNFKPSVPGYSFIPDLVGDISIDKTLFEIKTVNRNFKSSDLKQLFIYLALQQASGIRKWDYGGLYNPRRGTMYKFNIDNLIYDISGGITSKETFDRFLDNLVRDIELDSVF